MRHVYCILGVIATLFILAGCQSANSCGMTQDDFQSYLVGEWKGVVDGSRRERVLTLRAIDSQFQTGTLFLLERTSDGLVDERTILKYKIDGCIMECAPLPDGPIWLFEWKVVDEDHAVVMQHNVQSADDNRDDSIRSYMLLHRQ